jgi:hypothetical protein
LHVPVPEMVRALAARSGNRCAFPGCERPIVGDDARLAAQLCFIEGNEPGRVRFNPDMTNSWGRGRGNLVFLCLRHHIETDDEDEWPVARMKQMKADHEAQFSDRGFQISDEAIRGFLKQLEQGRPQTLTRFTAYRGEDGGMSLSPEQVWAEIIDYVNPLIDRLEKLGPDTRALLATIIERGEPHGEDLAAPVVEIEQVVRLEPHEIEDHVAAMERNDIAFVEEDESWLIVTRSLAGWAFWSEVKGFCEDHDVSIRHIVEGLRFDLLD